MVITGYYHTVGFCYAARSVRYLNLEAEGASKDIVCYCNSCLTGSAVAGNSAVCVNYYLCRVGGGEGESVTRHLKARSVKYAYALNIRVTEDSIRINLQNS